MRIRRQLISFVKLLELYWFKVESINDSDEFESFKEDWLQANWELIVERPFVSSGIFLQVYGEGAECNGTSSRVLFPEKQATHRIILEPINESHLFDELGSRLLNSKLHPIVFDKLTTFRDDWYYEEPPFNMIQGTYNDEIVIISLEKANLILNPIAIA